MLYSISRLLPADRPQFKNATVIIYDMQAKGKAMDFDELVDGLDDLMEKSNRLNELKSSRPEFANVLGVVEKVFPVLGSAKVVSLLAKYIGLTTDDMISLRNLKP